MVDAGTRAVGNTWAIVLAAGDGSRLRSLTTADGIVVPKQFCSLHGGRSLLHEALARATAITQPRYVCTIVAEQHRRWWRHALRSFDTSNVIVQPSNCGTANGILLPLLHVVRRDPEARIVLLPSDHYVHDERVLTLASCRALAALGTDDDRIVLLGIAPDHADPDLGYIVPGSTEATGFATVDRFVEKPDRSVAQALIDAGALWNAFIVVARASALLRVYLARFPRLVAAMRATVETDAPHVDDPVATQQLYRRLDHLDFSRHVIEGAERSLRVLAVPACGWCDLGTPNRVAATLDRFPAESLGRASAPLPAAVTGIMNLAAQRAAS